MLQYERSSGCSQGTTSRLVRLLILLLCGGWSTPAMAQQPVLSGRVLEVGGLPIPNATVRVTALPGNESRSAQTDALGRYRLTLPVGGEAYEVRAERVGYYGLTIEIAPAPGQPQIERDLRLSPRALELAPIEARLPPAVQRPPSARTPGGADEAQLSALGAELPLTPGDLSEIAALRPGVVALGDGRVSIAGQAPSQTSVTLDGASFGATSIPAEALRSTAVATSTYDPSRGQFSGGQIAATTLSGTNLFGGAARLRLGHPALQAGAAGTNASEYRLLEASGGAGGAILRHRLFWYGAAQATLRSSPLLTLQSAGPGVLRDLGISPDTVRRLQDFVQHSGLPPTAGAAHTRRTSALSALLRLDYHLGNDHVATLRLDGRTTRVSGVGESPFGLGGTGALLREGSGGAMAQVSSYVGATRNELRAYHSRGYIRSSPYAAGPSVGVRVGTVREDGSVGSTLLRFGGSPLGLPESEATVWELSDELLLRLGENTGRAKLGFVVSREQIGRSGSANQYGTFTFQSLADLEAGRPATFTRTMGGRRGVATADYLAGFAGHMWQLNRGLSIIYGARLEGRRYPGTPVADTLLGGRPGAIPAEWGVSPRLGFTYNSRGRDWALRGGIGEFRGKLPTAALAGLQSGTSQSGQVHLICVGPAAPVPDWALFSSDPANVPTECADGEPMFASRAPDATLFAPDFGAPRTWRSTLGADWSSNVRRLGNLTVSLDAAWTRGVSQPMARDRNFAAIPGFALAAEADRTVFVEASAVDPVTGGISPEASRVRRGVGIVREIGGAGRSGVLQLSIGTSLLTSRLDLLSASYTWTRARDQVGMLSAPGESSEPLAAAAPRQLLGGRSDLERTHLWQLRWSRPLHPLPLELGIVGRLTSGAPYTPRVDGDVNGDGLVNDAAFVFDPAATADSLVARGIERLLAQAPGGARRCLLRQLGEVAGRNRCSTPWTAEMDLQANLWTSQGRHARPFTVTATATNVLAGISRLLQSRGRAQGWGEGVDVDPVLLSVRGFDPTRRAFLYDVNANFGGRAPGSSRNPFTIIIQGRYTLGTDPVRQPLLNVFSSIRAQGRTPQQLREALAKTIPNPPAQLLALEDSLGLHLSPDQRERLHAVADSMGRRLALLADTLARAISTSETSTDNRATSAAREQITEIGAQVQAALDGSIQGIRAILTPDQWKRLPFAIQQPSRQVLPARGMTIRTGEVW